MGLEKYEKAFAILGRRLYNEAVQAKHWYGSRVRVCKTPDLSISKVKRILWEARELGIRDEL